jgi:hypothetical protein
MRMLKEKRASHDPRGVRRGYDDDPAASRAESGSESEDDDDGGDGHLDLRLGREKAGGGRKGKNAKLGKLIVEDEGLKMCDLVVAASMAVWWQHYEKMDHALK